LVSIIPQFNIQLTNLNNISFRNFWKKVIKSTDFLE